MAADKERYRKVSIRMWGDERFRRLTPSQPCGQALWTYLLTGPHTTNVPGVIPVPPAVIGAALRWPAKAFGEAFGEVLREGLAKADEEAGLIWLPKATGHNRPESPNVIRSWRVTWDLIPECALKDEIWRELKAFAEGLGKAFGEAFAKALPEGCRHPSPNQDQEQEQDPPIAPRSGGQPDLFALESVPLAPTRVSARACRKAADLATHRATAVALWDYQERLRAEAIGGVSTRAPREKDLEEIAEVLAAGYSESECRHVLRVYAAEAKAKPDCRRWFNGQTNWVLANFRRALGQSDPGTKSTYQPRDFTQERLDREAAERAARDKEAADA